LRRWVFRIPLLYPVLLALKEIGRIDLQFLSYWKLSWSKLISSLGKAMTRGREDVPEQLQVE